MAAFRKEPLGDPDRAWATAYLARAAQLRVAIRYHLMDYEFARVEGGRNVYLMDVNVVKIFLSPREETSHFRLLGAASLEDDLLVSSTMLAAENLMSGQL